MYTIILVIAQDRGEFEVMCKHKNIVQLHRNWLLSHALHVASDSQGNQWLR